MKSTLHGTGAGAERGELEQPFTALIIYLNTAMRLTGIFLPFKVQLSLCSFVLAHVSLVEVEKIVAKQLFFCIFITLSWNQSYSQAQTACRLLQAIVRLLCSDWHYLSTQLSPGSSATAPRQRCLSAALILLSPLKGRVENVGVDIEQPLEESGN